MTATAINLCARALIKIGAQPISAFGEGTAESEVAANLYPLVRDAFLSAHPWSFATAQARLPRLEAAPLADYPYAFQLPSDFLRVVAAGVGGRGRGIPYRLSETRLHAAVDALNLTYIFRPAESIFPAFFTQALIARLAAEFCLPLTESASRAELLAKLAEDEFRRAKLIDSQQEMPEAIESFPLVEVRA